MGINELEVKRTEKIWNEITSEKDSMIDAAKNFGLFFGDALKQGFSPEQSFSMARQHYRLYGKTMVEFAELVTIEMMPKDKVGV